ncbi:MAG: hypothetical protein K9G31_05325 [Crocinitomicaceae bacterium]|nr:hypothetical protein [Crocinitomicaceae bacterium]
MSNSSFFMMFGTMTAVTIITAYFFFKVLFSKPNEETDSFSENDNEPR